MFPIIGIFRQDHQDIPRSDRRGVYSGKTTSIVWDAMEYAFSYGGGEKLVPARPLPWPASKPRSVLVAARDSWRKWSPLYPRARWCVVVPTPQDDVTALESVVDCLVEQGFARRNVESLQQLPPSLEVMQERLEFLKNVGLRTEHIVCCPNLLCCSVARNMVPVVDYLEKIGIRASALPAFLRRFPMVLSSSVVVDLKPVVDYLLGYGVAAVDIPKVLEKYPDILGFKLEGTMSTSVAYLVGLGVNPRRIGAMVTLFPELLGMKVGNNIKNKVDYFSSELGFDRDQLLLLLERSPYVLGYDLEEDMKPVVGYLVDFGVEKSELPWMVAQFPDIFGLDMALALSQKTSWLAEVANIRPEEVPAILQKLPQILIINEHKAAETVYFFKRVGFSCQDVGNMVVGCPQILAMQLEGVLKQNLVFFQEQIRRPLSELVDFPDYFTYSLRERVQPRFARVKDRNINCSLRWFLACSDEKFERRLGFDYIQTSTNFGGTSLNSSVVPSPGTSCKSLTEAEPELEYQLGH